MASDKNPYPMRDLAEQLRFGGLAEQLHVLGAES
jgi:hypothetical protein